MLSVVMSNKEPSGNVDYADDFNNGVLVCLWRVGDRMCLIIFSIKTFEHSSY